jgi:uncharacterized HAD superfamily protein
MKKLRIAVDCDDVITPTASLITDSYNKTYGTSVALKDFYGDFKAWGTPDEATAIARIDAYLMSEEYQQSEPFAEAIDVLRQLAAKHELHMVTGRGDFLGEATHAMLDKYFPDIFSSVEFTHFFGDNPRPKSDVCQQLNIDVLIDDHPHHASIVAACGIRVLLFGDYPWNADADVASPIERARDWHEVAQKLL